MAIDVSQYTLARSAFDTSFETQYALQLPEEVLNVLKLARRVTHKAAAVIWQRLGAISRMGKAVEGNFKHEQLRVKQPFTVAVEPWGQIVDVPETWFFATEGTAQFMELSTALAYDAQVFPVENLLRQSADYDTPGYDGQPLISTSHEGESAQSNQVTSVGHQSDYKSTTGDKAAQVLSADINAAITRAINYKDDRGQFLYGYRPDAIELPVSDSYVSQAYGSLQKLAGTFVQAQRFVGQFQTVVYNPFLADNVFRLHCTSRPNRALFHVEERAPSTFTKYEDGMPYAKFGVQALAAFAPGEWRCMTEVTIPSS